MFAIERGIKTARAALLHLRRCIEIQHAFFIGSGDHLFDAGRGCGRTCFRQESEKQKSDHTNRLQTNSF